MTTNLSKCPAATPSCEAQSYTRAAYYSLRSLYRKTKRRLSTDEHAFATCLDVNAALRQLTGQWETGVDGPEYWGQWRREANRRVLFVSNAMQAYLRADCR